MAFSSSALKQASASITSRGLAGVPASQANQPTMILQLIDDPLNPSSCQLVVITYSTPPHLCKTSMACPNHAHLLVMSVGNPKQFCLPKHKTHMYISWHLSPRMGTSVGKKVPRLD